MDNENGVMSAFVDNLKELAEIQGAVFKQYPTGGSDRKLLGDTIFTNSMFYSLVEFKDSISKSNTELDKVARVFPVCEAIHKNSRMRELHDKCHFFAGDDTGGDQVLYVYRRAVCNANVLPGFFGDKRKCLELECDPANKIELYEYACDLFSSSSRYALPVTEFSEYLKMLVGITTKGKKGSEICLVAAQRDGNNKCVSKRFEDVTELHVWFQEKILKIPQKKNLGGGQVTSDLKEKSNSPKPPKSDGSGGMGGGPG